MKLQIERVEVFGVAMPLIDTFTSAGISKQATKCAVVRLTAWRADPPPDPIESATTPERRRAHENTALYMDSWSR